LKKFGNTFLTEHRWYTTDLEKADKSFWMWGEANDPTEASNEDTIWYGLSWLGVINGILYHLGDFRRLTAYVEENGDITGWGLRDFRET
jgi:hypothetical protein